MLKVTCFSPFHSTFDHFDPHTRPPPSLKQVENPSWQWKICGEMQKLADKLTPIRYTAGNPF